MRLDARGAMKDSDRPDLGLEIYEQIEVAQNEIEKSYWEKLKPLAVTDTQSLLLTIDPTTAPPIPKRPIYLQRLLTSYACDLFDAEASKYPNDPRLKVWLSNLAGRVSTKVDESIKAFGLKYHDVDGEIDEAIYEAIWKSVDQRLHILTSIPKGISHGAANSSVAKGAPQGSAKESRKAMYDAYLSRFPEKIYVLDICWAARQRHREWRRWLSGKLKDGSKPDKDFRAVLTSNKRPQEHRKETRDKQWK
jgi:hypothetical protein